MFKANSTVTTKGQITLPKTIRELMGLNTGDQVTFTTNSNKEVIMRKTEQGKEKQSLFNLISLLSDNEPIVLIQGIAGVGKNFLVKNFILNQFFNKKIKAIAATNSLAEEYRQLKDLMSVVFFEEDQYVGSDYDLIVIDAENANDSFIDHLQKIDLKEKKLILLSQKFEESLLIEIGNHLLIKLDAAGMNIEQAKLIDGEFERVPLYASRT